MAITHYRELNVWQESIQLVKNICQLSHNWPSHELYGLTSQLRRAAVSIPSNIAEGFGRRSARDFSRFLNIAHGSLMELETQLYIAKELGYISDPELDAVNGRIWKIGRMIYGLLRSLAG